MATGDVSIDSTTGRMKLSGLISNLDIQSIIDGLLKVEAAQKTAYETKKADLATQKDNWDEVKTKLEAFNTVMLDLNRFETWDKKLAESSDESVVTASASTGASTGLYNFYVLQLAQAHSMASDYIDTIVGTTGNTADTDLSDAGVLTANSVFYINDKAISVNINGAGENDTLTQIRNTINNTTFTSGDEVVASVINNTLVLTSKNTGISKPVRLRDDGTTRILERLGIVGQAEDDALTNGLYHFDTGSGLTATDSSGTSNGTISGAAWTTTSKFGGYALDFNAAGSNNVSIPSSTNNRITGNMTLEAWVNPDAGTMTDGMGVITKAGGAGSNCYSLEVDSAGTVTMRLSADGTNWTTLTSAATVPAGSYSHVAGVLEDGVMKIYINGQQDANTQAFAGAVFDSAATAVSVGSGTGSYFDGKIDEVRISATARKDFNTNNLLIQQQDAVFTINNVQVSRAKNTGLTDVITNTTINLREVGTASLNVTNDIDGVKTLITDFMDSYNTIQEYLHGVTTVIATGKSEEDVLTGVFQNEWSIVSLSRNLRNTAGGSVQRPAGQTPSTTTYLGAVGINTSGENYNLEFEDEGKLDTALANNFDDVEYLFRGQAGSLATKMYNMVDAFVKPAEGQIDQKKQRINLQISDITVRILSEQNRLDRMSDQLSMKFANMESRILDMNTQLQNMLSKLTTTS